MVLFKNFALRFISTINRNGDFLYLINRSLRRISIPDSSMSGSDLSEYLMNAAREKSILEFGCGGSTLLFANTGKTVTSVESDRYFSNQVLNHVLTLKLQDRVRIFWANIGPTKTYGQPWRITSCFFSWRFSSYSIAVFKYYKDLKQVDLVFVDGRFRVACVMSSLLNIEKNFVLVVDDYFDRPEYHIVSKILGNPCKRIHNTAIFEIDKTTLNYLTVEDCLEKHSRDPR